MSLGEVAGGGREVIALSKALFRVALAHVFELLLDFARGAPLGLAHEISDRELWWDFDEHMPAVAGQGPVANLRAHLGQTWQMISGCWRKCLR